ETAKAIQCRTHIVVNQLGQIGANHAPIAAHDTSGNPDNVLKVAGVQSKTIEKRLNAGVVDATHASGKFSPLRANPSLELPKLCTSVRPPGAERILHRIDDVVPRHRNRLASLGELVRPILRISQRPPSGLPTTIGEVPASAEIGRAHV